MIQATELRAQFLLKLGLAAVAAVEDWHVEAQTSTASNGCANVAHPDNAQGFAEHIAAEQRGRYAGLPLTCLGPGIQFCNAAGTAHDQRKTQVGGAFSQHVRGVGEHDPAFVEVLQIVVVVAHRHAGHHFQLLGVFQLLASQLAANANQAVGVGQGFFKLSIDVAKLGVGGDDIKVLLQALDHLGRDAAEGKYGFFCAWKAHQNKAHRLSEM